MFYIQRTLFIAGSLLLPATAFAQQRTNLTEILNSTSDFVNLVVSFLFVVATVVFLWGIVRYLTAGGDEEKVKEARSMILWGIIFLAVMVAVWGFVNIVLDFVFNDPNTSPSIPVGPQQP